MDGLADFEKALAKEKAEREATHGKEGRHRHHHHRHHHRHRDDDDHEDSRERRDKRNDRDERTDGERHRERHKDRDREGERDRDGRKSRRHDNGDKHRHRTSRNEDSLEDGDRQAKRARHSRDDNTEMTVVEESGGSGDERESTGRAADKQPPVRDSWMTDPSAINVDYVHRPQKEDPLPQKRDTRHVVLSRELNSEALNQLNDGKAIDEINLPVQRPTDYTFGDDGSQWRMTKLSAVYTTAEQTGRSVEEVAVERYGSLHEFDDAREEKEDMERRKLYGSGYSGKLKPSGDLYRERASRVQETTPSRGGRSPPSTIQEVTHVTAPLDQTALNRMRAQLMKAKLQRSPDAAKLEEAYNQAVAAFSQTRGSNSAADTAVVLDASHNRMLAGSRGEVKAVETSRGRKRGLVEANEDMSIDDMLREERRTRGVAGGEGMRLAERIAKDAKFDDDLDYLDENAEKLAKRVHKSESNLKNVAVNEFTKMNRVLENCPLCHHEDRRPPLDLPLAPIISLATRVYLTLATEPELSGAEGGAVIAPIDHHTNLLECNDDEWEEIRNFMKSLTRLYHDQGRDVVFYENAAAPHRRMHAALVAVPIPYELGETAPAFFREAMLSADEEWSQHKKIIDTGKRAREGMGKQAFRKSIAKEMPYFHAWFNLDGGLGHIVEDSSRWPKGDLFAREIIGGMVDADPSVIKRQGRWTRDDSRADDFKRRWRKFDWTRVLTEGG